MRKLSVIILVALSFLYVSPLVSITKADEIQGEVLLNQTFTASVGELGLTRDLSLNVFEGELQVGIPAGRFSKPALVTITKISEPVTPPPGLAMTGSMYQVDIPADSFSPGKYYISLKSSNSSSYKQVYFFDKNQGWRPLETNENFGKGLISTSATFPFLRIAVFENSKMLVKGDASWYRYKKGLFAASPDFPAGTKLRVINPANKKFVDITVNDFGPDRSKHPTRAIDLDAVAFEKLGSLGQGTMSVVIEKIPTTPQASSITKVTPIPDSNSLSIQSKAALVLNSVDKKVLWSKGGETKVPLASLTKLVAIEVFLDTKPDMSKVVTYSVADEEKNALYVLPGESARLKLLDKDQILIKDLVFSSLIGSTNNTVETLVRVSGVSRDAFIKRMNKKVVSWGATETHFIEPTGLSPKNITTPKDYAIIARQVFLNDVIAEASVKPSYSLTTINTKRAHTFKNTNTLAREKDSPILGSKTGYLVEAGYCLATKWPTTKDKNIIVVLFGAPNRNASVEDTKKLVAFAEKNIN
jgi:D-alanyl-D-alanine endopeptidase (penicillin-binding protein 7)